jgi:hypothetical protein
MHDGGIDEATAFLLTLDSTSPTASTACARWTAHDLVAHLTAGAAEMADLTEAATRGHGERPTKDLAAREAPYAAMADDELRACLVDEALRLSVAIEKLAAAGPMRTVLFAGRALSAAELTMHGRSEAALHRWDLAGDDDISQEFLGQEELTAHAVHVLNHMLDGSPEAVLARTAVAGITEMRANFSSQGHPDVVLVVDGDGARLELDESGARSTVSADPATRLLALWGRRSPTRAVVWDGHDPAAAPFADFLWAPRDTVPPPCPKPASQPS